MTCIACFVIVILTCPYTDVYHLTVYCLIEPSWQISNILLSQRQTSESVPQLPEHDIVSYAQPHGHHQAPKYKHQRRPYPPRIPILRKIPTRACPLTVIRPGQNSKADNIIRRGPTASFMLTPATEPKPRHKTLSRVIMRILFSAVITAVQSSAEGRESSWFVGFVVHVESVLAVENLGVVCLWGERGGVGE